MAKGGRFLACRVHHGKTCVVIFLHGFIKLLQVGIRRDGQCRDRLGESHWGSVIREWIHKDGVVAMVVCITRLAKDIHLKYLDFFILASTTLVGLEPAWQRDVPSFPFKDGQEMTSSHRWRFAVAVLQNSSMPKFFVSSLKVCFEEA